MSRPWSKCSIQECGEPLEPLPTVFHCLRPHPYQRLGAPYGEGVDPFCLRRGVLERLIRAEQQLQQWDASLRFAIFDAWRPVAVQTYMVEHALAEECRRYGLHPTGSDQPLLRQELRSRVGRFWAPPSTDPAMPPPHSTGAAVDLTLADRDGSPLEMGGAIDAIDAVSEPEFHAAAAAVDPESEAALWHQRRCLLAACLLSQGFARHPNEWWHFSFGDQLWAWSTQATSARYGRVDQVGATASSPSSAATA